jgi:hypothetical protein
VVRSFLSTAAAVLTFALLMAGLTATARGQDGSPSVVYVTPLEAARLAKLESDSAQHQSFKADQSAVNAEILAQLKALRSDVTALQASAPVTAKATAPAKTGCTDCGCVGTAKAVSVPVPAPTVTTVSARAPVGHTHTCAAGHTWDHTMDGGSHRCPTCGLPQFVQDSVPRMVRVPAPQQPAASGPEKMFTVDGTGEVIPYSEVVRRWPGHLIPGVSQPAATTYTIGVGSGGCANGACAAQTTVRFGR